MINRQRYFLELAYKGTAYHGWQIQPNAISVQEVLEKALTTLFRQKIETVGCGRTDTGVHASQFFAHFDCFGTDVSADALEARYLTSLNALLPYDIAVTRIIPVKNDAHARFDATQRSYHYYIHHHKNPFQHNFSWLLKESLDMGEMNKAASYLLDYTDFSCFSKSNTQVFTNNCKIEKAEWQKIEGGIIFVISADRFLRNMVRAIVGTLVEIGKNKVHAEAIHEIIQSKNRSNAGTSVPACGLYLTNIQYPYI